MTSKTDFDAMVDACIAAGHLVRQSGSPELQAVMRVLLFILGGEASKRDAQDRRGGGPSSRGDA